MAREAPTRKALGWVAGQCAGMRQLQVALQPVKQRGAAPIKQILKLFRQALQAAGIVEACIVHDCGACPQSKHREILRDRDFGLSLLIARVRAARRASSCSREA